MLKRDERQLVFFVDAAAIRTLPLVVNAASGRGSLANGEPAGPTSSAAAWIGGRLVVAAWCCPHESDPVSKGIIDALTGRQLVPASDGLVTSMHPDASEQFLLYVTAKGELYSWDSRSPGSTPIKLRDGVVDAAWVPPPPA